MCDNRTSYDPETLSTTFPNDQNGKKGNCACFESLGLSRTSWGDNRPSYNPKLCLPHSQMIQTEKKGNTRSESLGLSRASWGWSHQWVTAISPIACVHLLQVPSSGYHHEWKATKFTNCCACILISCKIAPFSFEPQTITSSSFANAR